MIYEVWEDTEAITCAPVEKIREEKATGLIAPDAKLLHTIEASTWNEAMIQYHELMGWEPYKPMDPEVVDAQKISTLYGAPF